MGEHPKATFNVQIRQRISFTGFHRVEPEFPKLAVWYHRQNCHGKVHYLTWGPSKRFQNQPIPPIIHLGLILLQKNKTQLVTKIPLFHSNLLRVTTLCFHEINPKRLGQNMTKQQAFGPFNVDVAISQLPLVMGPNVYSLTHQVFPQIWRWHREDSDVSWWLHTEKRWGKL